MSRPGRLFYIAPANLDPDAGAGGAAARNKVLAVCAALRAAGARPFVATTLPGARGVRQRHGIGFVRIAALGTGPVRRVAAAISLGWFAARHIRHHDRVILYNAFPEYLPLALILRLRGRRAIRDIEDAPLPLARSAGHRLNKLFHQSLGLLADPRAITASHGIATTMAVKEALPVYGTANAKPSPPRFAGSELTVHFGGSLMPETGLYLFRDAVRILTRDAPDAPIRFVVTGTLPSGALDDIADRVTLSLDLDDAAYRALLDRADVGLCLKLGSTEMGQTTFPSKVIEIAAAGMLLVSTSVSDVPLIFDDGCAVLLPDETPEALADALLAIERDRGRAAERAAAGRDRVAARFSSLSVGRAILDFIA